MEMLLLAWAIFATIMWLLERHARQAIAALTREALDGWAGSIKSGREAVHMLQAIEDELVMLAGSTPKLDGPRTGGPIH